MRNTTLPLPRRLAALLAATGTAAVLAGCGLTNPNNVSLGSVGAATTSTSTATTAASSGAAATTATPPPATTSQPTAAHAGGPSPQAVIEQYAKLWCNWTTGDLHAHERQLEALSVGGARTQEQLALAAATQQGGTSNVTNTCTIEALATGRGDATGKWVLVTASHTSTPSLQALPAQYHVTYVTLAAQGHGYIVNSWLPQS